MKYFLCGNTGTINRGCEAIIRSTVKILNRRSGDIFLATFAEQQDRSMAAQLGINIIPYNNYPTALHRYICAGTRKIFKKSLLGYGIIEKPLFSRIDKKDICLNIGGDTYCYGRPAISLALNKFAQKNGVKNILWCCSIEKENINKEILEDLNRYNYIFAREQITIRNLLSAGVKPEKVVRVCDPAFLLDASPVELPSGFIPENTVGINVSEMVINAQNPYVYIDVINVIKYIIDNTNMNICLIPHVYNIESNTNDYAILKQIYNEIQSDRVSIVDTELNCEQLKYIISKCRFFIGARTHSTIAAYSTGVPTLVLGYSVKSKGIATDIFGTYKDYVIPYNELTEKNELLSAFVRLIEKEDKIKGIYQSFLPEYKKLLTNAIEKYITIDPCEKKFSICNKEICTGCGACVQCCPTHVITMKQDEEGFLYPEINFEKCTNCGLCRKLCPAANKIKDTLQHPQAFAATIQRDDIREASSSGGVFTALAESIITIGGVVFGAAFDENMHVIHKVSRTKQELADLRGSKYVQSELGDAYQEAEKFLESGVPVLFTGTPCQIGGLYAYLKKEYENLYTQDFICHGVPSPAVWESYIKFREAASASKTRRTFFRHKKYGWKKYSVLFEFSNNTEYLQVLTEDLYMRGFLAHLYLRPSCSMCSFKQVHRCSDITLADFWGIEKIRPEINDDKGLSLVMLQSEKGRKLFESIKNNLTYEKVDFCTAILDNPSYYKSVKKSPLKSAFYKDFKKMNFDKLINKYLGNSFSSRLRRVKAKFFG